MPHPLNITVSPRFDAIIAAASPEDPFKLGVLGGTFDPVHEGHVSLAESATYTFGLNGVIFVPAGIPVRKQETCHASAEDRLAMLKLATEDNPYMDVSRIEVDREGPAYTIDTIRLLNRIYGDKAKLFFVCGPDTAEDMITWKDKFELARLVTVLSAKRRELAPDRRYAEDALIPDSGFFKMYFFDMPVALMSSSSIRYCFKNGLSVKYMIPEAVEQYIREHHLYE